MRFRLFVLVFTGLMAFGIGTPTTSANDKNLAQDIESSVSQYLSKAFDVELTLSYEALKEILWVQYEELGGFALPDPVRFFEYDDHAAVIHEDDRGFYWLDLHPFQRSGYNPQILLRLRMVAPDLPYTRFSVADWDVESGRLLPLPIQGEIPENDYDDIDTIYYDEHTFGITVSGASGAAGRVGDFTALVYNPGEGYEVVWTYNAPGPLFSIVGKSSPALLSYYEYTSWDNSFPVTQLSNLSMVDMYDHARQFWVTFTWDSAARSFVEIERREVMHKFAVVNHFLQQVNEESDEAASFLIDGTKMFDFIVRSPFDFKHAISKLFDKESQILSFPLQGDYLATQVGVRLESDQWVAIGVINPDVSVWGLPNEEEFRAFAIFELEGPDDPEGNHGYKISKVQYYETPALPRELMSEHPYDLRPSLSFDKFGIKAWVKKHGWEEANRRVKKIKTVSGVDNWRWVVGYLRSPVVEWVEHHYAADLHSKPEDEAEELYRRSAILNGSFYLLMLSSTNRAAVDPNNLRVVLTDDQGGQWEGVMVADDLEESQDFGNLVYSRTFWLMFLGPSTEEEWEELNKLTLYVIRTDILSRAELTWNFEPVENR